MPTRSPNTEDSLLTDVGEEKAQLRQRMTQIAERVSAGDALVAGEAISDRLAAWPSWRSAAAIVLFATLQGEVDTMPLIDLTMRDRKRLFFPRMLAGRTLEFAVVADIESLRPGRYGVLEPDSRCPAEMLHPDTIVLVPGVAFDLEGGRLGRGAGYYDRALAACGGGAVRPRFLGVGFERQIVPVVPMGRFDIRMDSVVTERGLFEAA